MARNTAHGKKVPIYKTWWFWVVIILFIYGFVRGIAGSDDEEDEAQEETQESTYNDSTSADGCEDEIFLSVTLQCKDFLEYI